MVEKIEKDHARFRQIVRGKIRQNLKKFMSSGELIGRVGKNIVSIPIPQIDIPHFQFGTNEGGGVGRGDGERGDVLGDEGEGQSGRAGDQPGTHILEVDVPLEELAAILGEELKLPRIEPRGKKNLLTSRGRFTGIARAGPESLRHFKRTYREALKRQIIAGLYDPQNPVIIPMRRDKRYRSWNPVEVPESAAVVLYLMDVSGSMGDEQKETVRQISFWIDTWLRTQFKSIETRYIVHDATAQEVKRDVFYKIRESGGTKISSAYALARDIIKAEYPVSEWNIYCFQFSDGDNWGADDTRQCVEMLKKDILPAANLFCYGQVRSAYGSGQFIKDLAESVSHENLIAVEIRDKDAIFDAVKAFLGKGR